MQSCLIIKLVYKILEDLFIASCFVFQESTEPDLIKWAIRKARVKDFESMSIETLENITAKGLDIHRDSMTTTPYQLVSYYQYLSIANNYTLLGFNKLIL